MHCRNFFCPILALAIATPFSAARADKIVVRSGTFDNVTIKGLVEGKVAIENKGKETSYDLDEIVRMEITGQTEFNNTELNRNTPLKVLPLYRHLEIDMLNASPAARDIARYRAIAPMAASGDYGGAIALFARFYNLYPTDANWKLCPVMTRDKQQMEAAINSLSQEIGKLGENGAPKLRKLLADLYTAGGRPDGAKAINDAIAKAAAEAAATRAVAATADKPLPAGEKKKLTVEFYTIKTAGAGRIVYVVDHSGSMIATFDFLREGIKKSVEGLSPEQKFAVVEFSAEPDAIFPRNKQPAAATADVRKQFQAFVDETRADGRNDDLLDPFVKALRIAFAMQPDVIYFLTDGNFKPGVADEVKKLNAGGKVIVNTVAFVKVEESAKKSLETIARENGGEFKFVRDADPGK